MLVLSYFPINSHYTIESNRNDRNRFSVTVIVVIVLLLNQQYLQLPRSIWPKVQHTTSCKFMHKASAVVMTVDNNKELRNV